MTNTDPSLIMIPHLFWRASASPPNALPIMFNCLLDNGSHLVLICDSLVTELQLCRRNLLLPIETELAMHADDKKTSVTLHKYVNLSLYDASGEYSEWTVRAIIAPNLCSPIILGLPFLCHNNIVVDYVTRSAYDKIRNFDLLNPTV